MVDFKNVAKNVADSSSFIMTGHVGRKNEEMLAGFPNGFTIIGADLAPVTNDDGSKGEMPVYWIAEDDKIFGKGGNALASIFREWVSGYNGDFEAMSADLAKSGGVKVKLRPTKTKAGRPYTAVEVID